MKKKNRTLRQQNEITAWLSVLPALVLVLLICGYPVAQTIIKSFTSWNGIGAGDPVGLKNYISILTDKQFWLLLRNTAIYLLFIPIQIVLGVIVAVLIYEEIPGWRFFRIVYYIPQVISTVIIGYLFRVIFSHNGPLNVLLMDIGMIVDPIAWLDNGSLARLIVIMCLVWINIGWQALLALGGLSSIPTSVYEAARLDGAGYWKQLFHITFPLLGRTVEYSCIVSVMWVFTRLFSLIYALTGGGPGYETTTVDYMIYLKSFSANSRYGYASALSVILIAIVLVLTVIQLKVSNRKNNWEG